MGNVRSARWAGYERDCLDEGEAPTIGHIGRVGERVGSSGGRRVGGPRRRGGQFAARVAGRRAAWRRNHYSPVRLGPLPVLPWRQWIDRRSPWCSRRSSAGIWVLRGRVAGAAATAPFPPTAYAPSPSAASARCMERSREGEAGHQAGLG